MNPMSEGTRNLRGLTMTWTPVDPLEQWTMDAVLDGEVLFQVTAGTKEECEATAANIIEQLKSELSKPE
jgi:hypothetical protein